MKQNVRNSLLAFAAQLPPQRGRRVLLAIAAKDADQPKGEDFDAALESMAVVMEARIAKELEDQFTE